MWTPLETTANIFTIICIVLAGRNNINTWWTGIVGCILFGVLFYNVQLYADSLLQVFFLGTGIYGWVMWGKIVPKIGKTRTWDLVIGSAAALIVAAGYGSILHHYTDAYAPWVDSMVLAFSVMAQVLLMARKRETWLVWLLVNTLSVPLFWIRELYMTSILYGAFWINAVVSWFNWNKIYKAQNV